MSIRCLDGLEKREKTGGQKSRDTVPLKANKYKVCIHYGGQALVVGVAVDSFIFTDLIKNNENI